MKRIFLFLVIILLIIACNDKPSIWIITAPAGSKFTEINKNGKTVIPNGRYITPVGKVITTAPHPYGLVLSNDGNIAVTANSGIRPLSVNIIHNILSDNPKVMQIPPEPTNNKGILASVFMGLAVSPDNNILYVSGGQENKVYIFDINTGEDLGYIDCAYSDDTVDYTNGYIGDMKISKDGKTLYAVDQIGFRLIIIDLENKKIKNNIPVGRYPFGLCLSPDEKKIYVANVGMFRYAYIKDSKGKDAKIKAIDFPAFGFNTEQMRNGIVNDSVYIPGLGDPNNPDAFSVFVIKNTPNPQVIAKVKTGNLVGQMVEGIPAVGGSSPNSIVATNKYVFVTNGNNDNISVISTDKDTVVNTIYLKPDSRVSHFRGVIPFGVALSPDNKTLFVAESGINAVAVIDAETFDIKGHIPTGWFPSKLAVTPDGKKLVIANAKGYGSGPNAGENYIPIPEGTYIGYLMKGSVQIVDIPDGDKLKQMTRQVIENNYRFILSSHLGFKRRNSNPVPMYPGQKESPIKHIVFISKENRTYDEIFGQMPDADGDRTLARYGYNQTFGNTGYRNLVRDATIMPNHLLLANTFAFSDNFYVDSDVSADGHRWLVNTYPNEWCETATAASYGGNRHYDETSKAPGKFAMNGSAGAVYPEDYNEAGSMWDHLERNNIDFYNFGFSIMFEPAMYKPEYKYTGVKHYVNFPVPQPLFSRTSKKYPTYNTAIPDQFRIDMFIEEFEEKWINSNDTMPSVITVIIPNDHGAWERPEAGYLFRESYMADNDLAVGRIVEFLSHTPYWKNMLIVITEDDAQNGVDHIDAHRSVLMLVSPWVKRNYVSHVHYSFGSIFKTFWNILGIPYLNQYDACANDLADFFTDKPDYTPYKAVDIDRRVFDPDKALDPLDEDFDWQALKNAPLIDDVEDMINASKEYEEFRTQNLK